MNLSDHQLYFAAVRSDLMAFLQQAFHTIYPRKAFMAVAGRPCVGP